MHLDRTRIGGAALALVLMFSLACAGDAGPSEDEQQQMELQKVEMLEAQQEALNEKRARLEELRQMEPAEEGAEPEEAEEGEGEEGEEGQEALTAEEIEAEIAQLEQEISTESQTLYSEVVEAFNANPPLQGEPLTELQRRIVRIKSDEDILVAQEYIEKGGNFQKAIQIYQDALKIDPEYERLQEALAAAEEERYMDEERFAQVDRGMTDEEVKDALGTPFHYNVQTDDQGRTVWLYPKSEQRDAAGVWFRGEGEDLTVIAKDFNAVPPRTGEEEEEEEG